MSYAPIQFETSLDDRNPTLNKSSVLRSTASKNANSSHRKRTNGRRPSQGRSDPPIMVHCHLCWDWVWQRPQQFVSRLSRRHKVLFVETIAPDPELAAPLARFRVVPEFPNVTILRLQFPKWKWDDGEYVDNERRRMVQDFLASPFGNEFQDPIQWFYDPMAVPAFLGQMGEVLTV